MTNQKTDFQALPAGWRALWRAHTQLPRELASNDFTIYVRAIGSDAAHQAIQRALQAMYEGRPALDIDEAYYNLTSAAELIEQGVSDNHASRLFETAWQGSKVEGWVRNPVFVVPDASAFHQAWETACYSSVVTQGTPMSVAALRQALATMPGDADVAISYPDLQTSSLQYETRDVRFAGLRTEGARLTKPCVFLDAYGGV